MGRETYQTEKDLSLLRPPLVIEGTGIYETDDPRFCEFVLPNGERFLSEPPVSKEAESFETATQELLETSSRTDPSTCISRVLEGLAGYKGRDLRYWTEAVLQGDPYVVRTLPFYVQSAIIMSLSLGAEGIGLSVGYGFGYRRVFINNGNFKQHNSPTNENGWTIDRAEIERNMSMMPILVSIAVPILHDRHSGYLDQPHTALLRSSSKINRLVFPGGHARGFEPTALREFREEVEVAPDRSEKEHGDRILLRYSNLDSVRFIGVLDQFIARGDGDLQRMLAMVYTFSITTSSGYESYPPDLWRSVERDAVPSLDQKETWHPVSFSQLYYDDRVYFQLAPVTQEILSMDKGYLRPRSWF